MSIWQRYTHEQRQEYIKFLQVYGALSNLFRQKQGDLIPYLDSKFQETVYAKVFNGKNIDIGNTPHDVLSVFGGERIGIGIKTWMGVKPSFQKVMQLKRYQEEISSCKFDLGSLAYFISKIKNEKMKSDYERLGLSEDKNIYHYITRDQGKFNVNECAYPLVNLSAIKILEHTKASFSWEDGNKEYKFTFADSQIWQKFDNSNMDTYLLEAFSVDIIDDPFEFLIKAYTDLINQGNEVEQPEIEEVYLPLYSYESKEVEEKSGLNAWRGAPKSPKNPKPRPLNEVYIPIPMEFHRANPDFFIPNILSVISEREKCRISGEPKPEVRFNLELPNGKKIPALITGSNLKNFQSGSRVERDENGKLYGQDALGQWLLIDVLGLNERTQVSREWLQKKGTDSVRLWRKKNDYSLIFIDLAPIGAFEEFMNHEPVIEEDSF
ncbi:restriction endonuclease PLD domain-containing protein [Acinetobacter bereziniae]|uniref:restriction endonuclease PLD domain-containing protein n=1 Tax=Acinetobacter bereziniae TaxID=106648 RepID=UPI0029546B05|nr:restriction endonuclease PLD domain-containing protein [Acinetobacter bereziniae]MDV8157073.1 NgoFVII family restriction endonuclease [Acinetobacter bereziniae]